MYLIRGARFSSMVFRADAETRLKLLRSIPLHRALLELIHRYICGVA